MLQTHYIYIYILKVADISTVTLGWIRFLWFNFCKWTAVEMWQWAQSLHWFALIPLFHLSPCVRHCTSSRLTAITCTGRSREADWTSTATAPTAPSLQSCFSSRESGPLRWKPSSKSQPPVARSQLSFATKIISQTSIVKVNIQYLIMYLLYLSIALDGDGLNMETILLNIICFSTIAIFYCVKFCVILIVCVWYKCVKDCAKIYIIHIQSCFVTNTITDVVGQWAMMFTIVLSELQGSAVDSWHLQSTACSRDDQYSAEWTWIQCSLHCAGI